MFYFSATYIKHGMEGAEYPLFPLMITTYRRGRNATVLGLRNINKYKDMQVEASIVS